MTEMIAVLGWNKPLDTVDVVCGIYFRALSPKMNNAEFIEACDRAIQYEEFVPAPCKLIESVMMTRASKFQKLRIAKKEAESQAQRKAISQ